MATGPTLPPQAYTREILTSAFNWLQTQPESVKKLATTPDALVGLFMRAQRFGASSMEADAPVSSQAFMSDLKNLAEGLKQFEGPKSELKSEFRETRRSTPAHASSAQSALAHAQQIANQLAQAHAHAHSQNQSIAQSQAHAQVQHTPSGASSAGQYMSTNHQAHQASSFLSLNAETSAPTYPNYAQQPIYQPPVAPPVATMTQAMMTTNGGGNGLNERAYQMIHEVKIGLNLSSDAEAINLMVSLAYKHLKNLLG